MHAELILEVPVEHGLLLENLLDLAHAPFTHTSTFAKGWPIPDVVKFNAQKLLGGNWEPSPIDMAFEPPCMGLSTIGTPPGAMPLSLWQRPGGATRASDLQLLRLSCLMDANPDRATVRGPASA